MRVVTIDLPELGNRWHLHAGDPRRVVVDVRERDEFAAGHLPGAVHVPVHEVDRRRATLPPGELWVHCKSGYPRHEVLV